MTVHLIPVQEVAVPYWDKGRAWKTSLYDEWPVETTYNKGSRFSFYFADADSVSRQVLYGPIAQGAYALATALPSVIAAEPIPTTVGAPIKLGDILVPVCDGEPVGIVAKVVSGGRWADSKLEIVHAEPATQDWSEYVAQYNAQAKEPVSESWLSG